MNFDSEHLTTISILRKKINNWRNICLFIILIFLSVIFFSVNNQDINKILIKPNSIVRITVEDVLIKDKYRDQVLENIKDNKNIAAILLKINSPGGDIVVSEELLYKFKEIAKSKPLVVAMESVAASGGYLVSLAADHIIARSGTITGSIGVIMQAQEVVDLADKLGINFLTYKSAPLKSSPSFFEKETREAKQAMQEVIDDSYDFFADIVKSHRKSKIKEENFDKIFDGRIFNGRQALKMGLIDEIGGEEEAISYLLKRMKIKDSKIIDIDLKEKKKNFFPNIDVGNLFNGNSNNSLKIRTILQ